MPATEEEFDTVAPVLEQTPALQPLQAAAELPTAASHHEAPSTTSTSQASAPANGTSQTAPVPADRPQPANTPADTPVAAGSETEAETDAHDSTDGSEAEEETSGAVAAAAEQAATRPGQQEHKIPKVVEELAPSFADTSVHDENSYGGEEEEDDTLPRVVENVSPNAPRQKQDFVSQNFKKLIEDTMPKTTAETAPEHAVGGEEDNEGHEKKDSTDSPTRLDNMSMTQTYIGEEISNALINFFPPTEEKMMPVARTPGESVEMLTDEIMTKPDTNKDRGKKKETAVASTALPTASAPSIAKTEFAAVSPVVKSMPNNPLLELIEKWNNKALPWLQISVPFGQGVDMMVALLKSAATVRSNLASAASLTKSHKEEVKRFDKYWRLWQEEIAHQGYEVFPGQFGKMADPVGHIIYSSQPTLTQPENVLILPGLRSQDGGEEHLTPVSLVSLPPTTPFPGNHAHADLDARWRGILGELELLLMHLDLQTGVVCGIETVNKTALEPFAKCRQNIVGEIKRRAESLCESIRKKENIYRLATNYWRVEECFWAIFHEDGRPRGYSFFDRLRKRLQAWRTSIRQEEQLFLRDFACGRDHLASVNKYIGNIILQNKSGVAAGIILRELRPALVVKVNNVTRLLKGRVIAT